MLSKQNTWQDWANLSPLVPEIASAIQIQPLEKSIKDAIPHLEEICHRPRSYLKMETEKLPVARVQRIAPHAIAYLTSHTEDWECKTFRGIRPKNVLSLVREELLDIYENRVAVRLIDHVLIYLRQRIRDVERLKNELEQVLNFSKEASQSIHYRNRTRICRLWGENFDAAPQLNVAKETLNFLQQIKQKLLTLTDTDLYKAIPRGAEVEGTLRNTNILIGDRHYREIAKLWREWSKWRSKRSKTVLQLFDFYQQTINGFDAFCCLLCSKVLIKTERDRGFGYLSDSALPERGQSYSLQQDSAKESESLNFQWLEDGSIQLESEKLGILKFIPLVAQLAESPDEQTSEQILKLLESVIDQANSQPYRTIILYFGTAQDVSKISPKLRRYFNTIGNDLLNSDLNPNSKSDRKLALLPVSPFDILSTERFARAVQWWIYSQKYSAYPIKNVLEFRLSDELLRQLQQSGAMRQSPQNNQLLVMRPLSPDDRRVFNSNLHSMIKKEEAKGNSSRGEVIKLRQLENLPESIAQEFESFLTCPTCQAKYSATGFDISFENIGNDCFTAHCQQCETDWGLQRCGQCQTNYPYIKLSGANPEISDRSVGWCDRVFGRDVLAMPCFDDRNLQFYICSNCGSCGNSSQSSSYSCQRC